MSRAKAGTELPPALGLGGSCSRGEQQGSAKDTTWWGQRRAGTWGTPSVCSLVGNMGETMQPVPLQPLPPLPAAYLQLQLWPWPGGSTGSADRHGGNKGRGGGGRQACRSGRKGTEEAGSREDGGASGKAGSQGHKGLAAHPPLPLCPATAVGKEGWPNLR